MSDLKEIKRLLENDEINGQEALIKVGESLSKTERKVASNEGYHSMLKLKDDLCKAKTFLDNIKELKDDISRDMIEIDMLKDFLNPKEFEVNKKGLNYLIDSISH